MEQMGIVSRDPPVRPRDPDARAGRRAPAGLEEICLQRRTEATLRATTHDLSRGSTSLEGRPPCRPFLDSRMDRTEPVPSTGGRASGEPPLPDRRRPVPPPSRSRRSRRPGGTASVPSILDSPDGPDGARSSNAPSPEALDYGRRSNVSAATRWPPSRSCSPPRAPSCAASRDAAQPPPGFELWCPTQPPRLPVQPPRMARQGGTSARRIRTLSTRAKEPVWRATRSSFRTAIRTSF